MNKQIMLDWISLSFEKAWRGFFVLLFFSLPLGLSVYFIWTFIGSFGVWGLIGILSIVLLSWGIGHMIWKNDPNFWDHDWD